MKLPKWIPEASRPLNPTYWEYWETLDAAGRRMMWFTSWSMYVLMLMLVVIAGLVGMP